MIRWVVFLTTGIHVAHPSSGLGQSNHSLRLLFSLATDSVYGIPTSPFVLRLLSTLVSRSSNC